MISDKVLSIIEQNHPGIIETLDVNGRDHRLFITKAQGHRGKMIISI